MNVLRGMATGVAGGITLAAAGVIIAQLVGDSPTITRFGSATGQYVAALIVFGTAPLAAFVANALRGGIVYAARRVLKATLIILFVWAVFTVIGMVLA